MKFVKKILFYIVFNIFFLFSLQSNESPKGILLCNELLNICKQKGFHTEAQNLIPNINSDYPYNIIISNEKDNSSNENMILLFEMEDVWENKNILISISDKLKQASFNSTILISYNEDRFSPLENNIKGSEVFLESLNTNDNNYVFIVNLNAKNNAFVTGSDGLISPSWMAYNAFSAYTKAKLDKDIPFYYLSQVSKLFFLKHELLSVFLSNDIPAIQLNFNLNENSTPQDKETVISVLNNLLDNYEKTDSKINDYHCLILNIFNRTICFTEYLIVKIIIIVLFFAIALMFLVSFIHANFKNQVWDQLKKNWHVIPSTLFLIVIGFFGGKYLRLFLVSNFHIHQFAYSNLLLQIVLSSFLVSAFYLWELIYIKSYGEKSIDFLIVVTTVVNLIIFTIIDISLFTIFLFITIFSFLSLWVRRNWTHIILCIFMLITFLPYIFYVYAYCEPEALISFFREDMWHCVIIPLILLPIHLMLLRIYTATKKRFTKKKVFLIIVSSTFVFFVILFITVNHIFFTRKETEKKDYIIESTNEKTVNLTYTDKKIFSDVIRTVNIDCSDKPAYIEFVIFADEVNPVLYSDNKYKNLTWNTVLFAIPKNPPEKLSFSYGAAKANSIIQTKTFYQDPNNSNKYYLVENSLFLEDK